MHLKLYTIIKTWKLPVAMTIGVLLYFLVAALPLPTAGEGMVNEESIFRITSHVVQPCLIFLMLTLSFLKVSLHDMKPHRWHFTVLCVQSLLFIACSLAAYWLPEFCPVDGSGILGVDGATLKILLEGAMLCFVCPTATASAVIVQKLGGSLSGIVTYIILCNLMVSVLAPGFLTLVEPHHGLDFMTGLFLIMGKVFPLLLFPLFVSTIIRHYLPRLSSFMLRIPDLAFYLWLVALALAICVTVRTIVESHIAMSVLMGLAVVSLAGCLLQFWLGRRLGGLTGGQAFGQKNTVFVIWMGLVFLNPVTSVVGGFYSVWHNIINSWQLYQKGKKPIQ